MPDKQKIFAWTLGICSIAADIAALVLIHEDDTGFLYFVLFPLAGLFGLLSCRALDIRPEWGLGVPIAVMFLLLPFALGESDWWFQAAAGMLALFGVFFALLILAGWLMGYIPVKMAERRVNETKSARNLRRLYLALTLAVVVFLLLVLWNAVFGNPVTAIMAGQEMRDWIAEQAEAGAVYEIMGDHLPRYNWYNTEYIFDLAGEGSRWVLHWNEGEIRLDSGGW